MIQQARHLLEADGDRAISTISASSLAGRRVLITGASGLIGTGIVSALRSLRIAGIDLHVTAHGFSAPPLHFLHWQNEGHLSLLQSNLADPEAWCALPEADIIIHAAGYGQPGKFMAAPLNALMLNTGTTAALLKKITPGGSFLFFSSTEVYRGSTALCLLKATSAPPRRIIRVPVTLRASAAARPSAMRHAAVASMPPPSASPTPTAPAPARRTVG